MLTFLYCVFFLTLDKDKLQLFCDALNNSY